jgi:hypothetical protein
MSEETFLVALKSTLDKVGNDLALAQTPPVTFVDLLNVVNTQALFESEDDALVWEFMTLQESPRDPLYQAHFDIGARTVNDPANYDILTLVGQVKTVLPYGQRIEIRDYSGLTQGPVVGIINVISVAVMEQTYDKVSGIRMITVIAKATRLG